MINWKNPREELPKVEDDIYCLLSDKPELDIFNDLVRQKKVSENDIISIKKWQYPWCYTTEINLPEWIEK